MTSSPRAQQDGGVRRGDNIIDLEVARRGRRSGPSGLDRRDSALRAVQTGAKGTARPPKLMDLFNVITWSMEEGVCTLDGERRLTFMNPAAERALEWSVPELRGRELHPLLHGHNGGPCRVRECPLSTGLDGAQKITGETQLVRRDGTSFPASFNFAPLGRLPGEMTGGVLVFTDLSNRRQSEEHLRRSRQQSERLEALEHAKSQFLNLASHELRGPLAVVRGYISMIEDGSLGSLSPELTSVVPILALKLRQMDMLVNDMLETARLEDSRMQLDLEQVDLRRALADAVKTLEPIAATHRVRLELGRRPVPVQADPTRLGNILTNLVDNAVKYSPKGGEVVCQVGTRGGQAYVAVTDQGLGIAPQHLDKLFTRFGRVVTRQNDHIPGTGLGLYLARELARLHGGDISVVSRPGIGSTFTLVLPLNAD